MTKEQTTNFLNIWERLKAGEYLHLNGIFFRYVKEKNLIRWTGHGSSAERATIGGLYFILSTLCNSETFAGVQSDEEIKNAGGNFYYWGL